MLSYRQFVNSQFLQLRIRYFSLGQRFLHMCAFSHGSFLKEALNDLAGGLPLSPVTYVYLLQVCGNMKALVEGKRVHAHLIKSGLNPDGSLGSSLILMYVKCNRLMDASKVFLTMSERDRVSWTVMISGFCQYGYVKQALKLFLQIQEGLKINRDTLVNILKSCVCPEALALGKLINLLVVDFGFESDVGLVTALVSMFGRCGSIEDSRGVFNRMPQRNVVSWNAIIAVYARYGYGREALELFEQMLLGGMKPNKVTFISMLNAFGRPESLSLGKVVHGLIRERGLESDIVVGNALLSMYAKCGSIEDVLSMFDRMPDRNVVSWNAVIGAYIGRGLWKEVFDLFQQMQYECISKPNKITFISILKACATLEVGIAFGRLVHAQLLNEGMESDVVVGTALVNMYGKYGKIQDARRMFDKMPNRNVVSWNIMIDAYAEHGYREEAFKLFEQMQQGYVKLNKVTFITILNACATLEGLVLGKLIHACIIDTGMELDVVVRTSLLSMYSKSGGIVDAERIFEQMAERSVISWNVMIAGYVGCGYVEEAFKLFRQMQQEGVKPDKVTFLSLVNACTGLETLALGKVVHKNIVRHGLGSDIVVGAALINMYGKCKSTVDARRVFDKMPGRNATMWSAMVITYAQNGHDKEALQLFQQMQLEGFKPDRDMLISVLNACADLAALVRGRQIHTYIMDSGMETDLVLRTALLSMYVRCGSIKDAQMMFNVMDERNVVTWNAMIAGYGQHGHGKEALKLFNQMQEEGLTPDAVTLINVLSACSHAGLVNEGICYFNSIQQFGVVSTVEHYNCMVDLLGRAGQLDEAEDFIIRMSLQPDAITWMTLLGACRAHCCVELGKRAAECALKLDRQLAPAYVVLSNIYAAA